MRYQILLITYLKYMIAFSEIKNNPQVLEFINQSESTLKALEYNEHGFRHINLVSDRARNIAKEMDLTKEEQELVAIAGFCHDMGNFLGRLQHHYWGALLFHQIFQNRMTPEELAIICQAIANHDKEEMKLNSSVASILVIADKSDVHRSRVRKENIKCLNNDIHDRVNFAVTETKLKIDKTKKIITLTIKLETKIIPIIEYFEIFTERMVYCRKAAEYLGYKFGLVINNFKLA